MAACRGSKEKSIESFVNLRKASLCRNCRRKRGDRIAARKHELVHQQPAVRAGINFAKAAGQAHSGCRAVQE